MYTQQVVNTIELKQVTTDFGPWSVWWLLNYHWFSGLSSLELVTNGTLEHLIFNL